MGLTLVMNPRTLTWSSFQVVDTPPTDDRGNPVSAFVAFTYSWSDYVPVKKDGKFALPDTMRLTIEPDARVWKDSKARTDKAAGDKLLSHEQFHYELAYAIGRVVLLKMLALRADSAAELQAQFEQILNLHFQIRAGLIQRRYDLDTKHGQDAYQQRHWKRLMAQTLAQPNSRMIGGYWL